METLPKTSSIKNTELHFVERTTSLDLGDKRARKMDYRTPQLDPTQEKTRKKRVFNKFAKEATSVEPTPRGVGLDFNALKAK